MKRILLTAIVLLSSLLANAQVETIAGKWQTMDDKTGELKSLVQIFKATNGKYYGKVLELYKDKDAVCSKCEGENHNKPIVGMMVVRDMVIDGDVMRGTILDPASGKVYYATLSLEGSSKLKVRGSLDKKGFIGRTQYWKRSK